MSSMTRIAAVVYVGHMALSTWPSFREAKKVADLIGDCVSAKVREIVEVSLKGDDLDDYEIIYRAAEHHPAACLIIKDGDVVIQSFLRSVLEHPQHSELGKLVGVNDVVILIS